MADRETLNEEFERAAKGFAARTAGRFDSMRVVEFARVDPQDTVVEVGAGTGNFLSLFEGHVARLVALDLTEGMLREGAARYPWLDSIVGDGLRLPFRSASVDIVASAQALHHVFEPLGFVKEMRRVCAPDGKVLIVDQAATESYEQIAFMNQLEVIRDPSHAMSRPPSAFRAIVMAAGLEIVDERLHEEQSRFSKWMWPGEFPQERIDATRDFVERFGGETGMNFDRDGDDWVFTRRRIMLLAKRGG
ncbi:MAG: class I SAM-dependent methyltransferase [Actinomycetota bacterium]|nr:class I SAM-dependent methyltransferase [Actinomycetota bacterium]